MKILFFIESLRAGGKERRIVELLKGLKSFPKIQVELVLTRREIHYKEILQLGIPIHFAERRFLKKDPFVFLKFYRIARKFKPDIIHVWGHMVAFYAVPAKKLLRVPLLNSEITDATPGQKLIAKQWVFAASDKIIANTRAGLLAYQAPPHKSGVIYNGFNFERLKKVEAEDVIRSRYTIRTRFVIAMVASFSDYKDYTTYITSAIKVLEQYNDVTFLCIGDGDDKKYRELVPEVTKEKILFLGKQNNVESIMNICDVGVLTTNTTHHGEGISNALMEFMALGKPVIATNFGGSVELIEQGVSGFLIAPFDYTSLTRVLLELLMDTAMRDRIGKQSLNRIQERFSITQMVESFYKEYKGLISVSDE